jgi:Raf kinase inhibitor-like YbhB/YbcL family protein
VSRPTVAAVPRPLVGTLLVVTAAVTAAACSSSATVDHVVTTSAPRAASSPPVTATTTPAGALALSSAAFAADGAIPQEFTCDGRNVSPPLQWTGVPSGTRQLGIVVVDPDAPARPFVHWVMWDVPTTLGSLAAGARPAAATQGRNGGGRVGYTGPCPPSGTHHYHFELFALRAAPAASVTSSPTTAIAAIEAVAIAKAELVGTYARA